MKCPVCSNVLQRGKSGSVDLEVCPNCKGIWFDGGELVDVSKKLAASDKIKPKKINFFEGRDVRKAGEVKEKDRSCPKCSEKLRRFNYSYDSNVFLDKCPRCGGIWADVDEVTRIAEYLKDDPLADAVGQAMAEQVKELEDLKSGREFKELPVELARQGRFLLFFPRVIIPISDDAPRECVPAVTISIIVFCIVFFVGKVILEPAIFYEMFKFIDEDAWTVDLVSAMFISGGTFSLLWNMLFLWLFGDNVEDKFSRLGYLFFYLSCGAFASLLYGILGSNLSISAVGVSGAVSGVMGAYFIFYPTANIKLFVIYKIFKIPTVVCLGAWFIFQLVAAFWFRKGSSADMICLANISGFLLGMFVAYCKKVNA